MTSPQVVWVVQNPPTRDVLLGLVTQLRCWLTSCLQGMLHRQVCLLPYWHLQPHLLDDVTSAIDQPLQTARDPCTGRDYVTSEYNRHDDCYRSPWCNKFHPPTSAASGAT